MSVDENGLPFGKPVGPGSEPFNFETPQAVLAHREFMNSAFHRGLERRCLGSGQPAPEGMELPLATAK